MSHTASMPAHVLPIPLELLAPPGPMTRPRKSAAAWATITSTDGGEVTKPGFAQAWTRDPVLVQVLWPYDYYAAARELWLDASRITRHVIEPQWPGRG